MPRKTQENRRIYKVFIASPGDVATERGIAFAVIDELNRIYESQGNDYRLEVRAWEKHSHPDLGLPQEVIKRQIPIKACDIFIGVFWKRFGTPPGSVRPRDGKPYLSGTEEEIEMAIEARKASSDQRPVIMLYRKSDPIPDRMKDDEYLQHARVIEFFQQCGPDGEHPALVGEFAGEQFRDVLRQDLLQVLADFESQEQSIYPASAESEAPNLHHENVSIGERDISVGLVPKQMTVDTVRLRTRLKSLDSVDIETLCLDHFPEVWNKFSRGQRRDEMINMLLAYCRRNPEEVVRLDALLPPLYTDNEKDGNGNVWLKRIGLTLNPFQYWTTEDNLALVSNYQVQPKALRSLDEQIRNDMNSRWIFFANKGWGKTALCQMIAKSHYPLKENDDGLCIVCGRSQLEKVFALAGNSLEVLEAANYITVMKELILASVKNVSLCNEGSGKLGNGVPQGLEDLTIIIRQQEFKYLICLVDQVDEVRSVEAQPEKMVQLLRSLMRLSWRSIPGITFRYFLPSSLAPLLKTQNDIFRLDRYQVVPLKWEQEDLQQLIARRLYASSEGFITSLGQLCEPRDNFRTSIDQELVQLAEGSPRATIWLANRLIQLHCQTENPPYFIQPATWQQVKADWQMYGRDQLFGSPTQSNGFVLAGERVYFQGEEVILSEKYDALLRCLIRAGERVCTKEELIKAGWPGDRPEGVTEEALTEAMRRMKAELKKQGGDPRWITTVRGRGYRLQKPKEA